MATECKLLNHVKTQAPYTGVVALWSILVGTIPSGKGAYGNGIAIFLGFVAMLFHTICTAEFAINKSGRYDIFTEIYLRMTANKAALLKLKEDVVIAYETGEPVPLPVPAKNNENPNNNEMGETKVGVTERVEFSKHKELEDSFDEEAAKEPAKEAAIDETPEQATMT